MGAGIVPDREFANCPRHLCCVAMTGWIGRLLVIGASEDESTDERLRRALMVTAAALMMPAGFLWGLMYLAFGEPRSALVPWAYVLVSFVSLAALARNRNYPVFAGVILSAPRATPDHALRAARAALAIQDRGRALTADHPGWPRFRIGLNSGPAVVGNIGSDEFRNFTAIGDTVNMAQRFETMAEPGQVVAGPSTAEALDGNAELESLEARPVKGKTDLVRPCLVHSVATPGTLAWT